MPNSRPPQAEWLASDQNAQGGDNSIRHLTRSIASGIHESSDAKIGVKQVTSTRVDLEY